MFIWIIILYATFLSICADFTFQQDRYEKRLNHVETILVKQANEIDDLRSVVLTQKNEITKLKMTLSKVKRLQKNHNKSIMVLRRLIMRSKVILELAPGEDTLSTKKNEDKNLEPFSEIITDGVSSRRESKLLSDATSAPNIRTVAFYAQLSHNELNPGPHHIIVFDLVKTNIHNSYNHYTGAFTAPINGVYGFIYTLRMYCRAYGTFEIVKNDEVEGTIHVNVENGCSGQFATGSIIVALNVGDTVFVRSRNPISPNGNILSDINGPPYFAGWLIASL